MNQVVLIAAAGEAGELGLKGDLPWHLPDDFKRFKQLTTGHPMLMGRKTFETFPKPLPNRRHIVITRDNTYTINHPACEVAHSLEDALGRVAAEPLVFVIGGGEIYSLALPYASAVELTRVHGEFPADTFFPALDPDQWKLQRESHHPADESHAYAFTYRSYTRKGAPQNP